MKQKDYKAMTAEEQLQYVVELQKWEVNHLSRIKSLRSGEWTKGDTEAMQRVMTLISAFAPLRDFAEDALRYGDYAQRVYRLDFCLSYIKKELAKGVTVADANGNIYAYAPQMKQQYRRRGRPTKEEEVQQAQEQQTMDVTTRHQQAVAFFLGVQIVTAQQLREKNNDELAQEREQKKAKEEAANPSLFDNGNENVNENANENEDGNGNVNEKPSFAPTVEGLSQTRLHLDQLRFLLSPALQERVDTVRDLRTKASTNAETAKRMAERGDAPADVEPFAHAAAEATEAYEQIYADVDTELATIYYRIKNDGDYRERFDRRYKVADFSAILKRLKPYYEKVQSPELDKRMQALIEQESPEYVARMKREAEKKEEVEGILRYLKRKDKDATDKRLAGAREKWARLVELIGQEEADDYAPLMAYIEEENRKYREAKAARQAEKEAAKKAAKKTKKQESKKTNKQ